MTPSAKGALIAVTTFVIWGFFPIYWKRLDHVAPLQILAHRIVWSLVFAGVLFAAGRHRWEQIRDALRPSTLGVLATSAALVAANWLTYIYAVNTERIVEASLGYFINPLVDVLLGVAFLKERLTIGQIAAVLLAGAGLAYLTWDYGRLPWIAVTLAVTLGTYGLLRKTVAVGAVTGLLVETALLTPLAAAYLGLLAWQGRGAFGGVDRGTDLLLVGAGVITATTLVMFVRGARLLAYSTLGILQYIIPTLVLLVGLFVYHEPFTGPQRIAFGLVWCATLLYCGSLVIRRHR